MIWSCLKSDENTKNTVFIESASTTLDDALITIKVIDVAQFITRNAMLHMKKLYIKKFVLGIQTYIIWETSCCVISEQ